jgi:hypothetical protein
MDALQVLGIAGGTLTVAGALWRVVASATRVGFEVERLRTDLNRLESKVKELEDTRVSAKVLTEKLQSVRTDTLQRVELRLKGGDGG